MIVLSASNVTKSFVVDNVLEDITFTVEDKDKIGIIGNNGSGKTTLLDIIADITPASSGNIFIRKDFKLGYLKQHTNINSNLSLYDECLEVFDDLIQMEKDIRSLEILIAENHDNESKLNKYMDTYSKLLEEFTSKNGYAMDSEIRGTLKGLGFNEDDFNKPVNVMSGGQKSRLSLAKLLLSKPDILLLDEPTNHLDIDAINWLEIFLNDYDGACLLISHDRYFLDNVVNKIFLIENTNLKTYNTDYSKYIKQRKKELEDLKKQFLNQQSEIKRQKEIIERFSNYGGSRYIKQAQARQKLLDKMERIEIPEESKKAKIFFEPKIQSGRDVLRIENLKKSYNKTLFENVDFSIYRGEKVGLIGGNGVGKTTLFKMILEKVNYDDGEINLGHHVNIGYFDQEQSNLNDNNTILDEIWDDNPNFNHYQLRRILSQFLFVGDDIFKEISELSGGERGRLAILKMMLSNSNFLLMDEPTNHLDIDSKEILEDALLNYTGSLLVISHDRYFLNRVVDRIVELTPSGSQEFLGNYNYYLKKKAELNKPEEIELPHITKTQLKLDRKKEREKKNIEKKKRKEFKILEENIFSTELEIESIDNMLCDEDIYSNPDKVLELGKKRDFLESELSVFYKEWEIMVD